MRLARKVQLFIPEIFQFSGKAPYLRDLVLQSVLGKKVKSGTSIKPNTNDELKNNFHGLRENEKIKFSGGTEMMVRDIIYNYGKSANLIEHIDSELIIWGTEPKGTVIITPETKLDIYHICQL